MSCTSQREAEFLELGVGRRHMSERVVGFAAAPRYGEHERQRRQGQHLEAPRQQVELLLRDEPRGHAVACRKNILRVEASLPRMARVESQGV